MSPARFRCATPACERKPRFTAPLLTERIWVCGACRRGRFLKRPNWKDTGNPFRSSDLGVMSPARFLCAMPVNFWDYHDYLPGNRTRHLHPEIAHFTDRCLNRYTTASIQRISLKCIVVCAYIKHVENKIEILSFYIIVYAVIRIRR